MKVRLAAAVCAQVAALALILSASSARAADTCSETPDTPALAGTAEEVLARARAAFTERRFAAAAPLFHAVAMAHPDTDAGRSAVQLSLESLNKAAEEKGTVCYDVIAEEVPAYLRLYCEDKARPEPCTILHKIARDIERLAIENGVIRKADRESGARARALYREAGDRYIAIWNEHTRDACRNNRADGCARGEELLYNAARAYQAARELDKAHAARAMLVDPENHLAQTEVARKSIYEDASTWMAIGEYEQAAAGYERFVTVSPTSEHGPDALGDALILRLGLGDLGRAEKDFDAMVKLYGARQQARVASVSLALAISFGERSQWKDAERILRGQASTLAKATPTVRLRADAMLGKALAALGKKAEADAVLKPVAATRTEQLSRIRDDDPEALRELGRALTAIGEAKLYFADQARDAAMKRKVKKGDKASLEEKRRAVEEAEKAYAGVIAIEPMPPPRAVVAAAGSVARMRSQLWAQVYLAMGSAAAEPEERAAIAAHERCLALSTKYQAVDDGSRRCAAWLERHQPARFPPLREIMPRPRYQADGLTHRPLDEDGEPRLPLIDRGG